MTIKDAFSSASAQKSFFAKASNPHEVRAVLRFLRKNKGAVNAQDAHGVSLLQMAIRSENRLLALYLIRHGADVNHQNGHGITVMMSEVIHRGNAYDPRLRDDRILRALAAAGARADVPDRQGKTALDLARETRDQTVLDLFKSGGGAKKPAPAP